MKSFSFSGLKWKIDTGSGVPTKEEEEREVAVLCLCPRPFPEGYFPKWRAAKCSVNVLEGFHFSFDFSSNYLYRKFGTITAIVEISSFLILPSFSDYNLFASSASHFRFGDFSYRSHPPPCIFSPPKLVAVLPGEVSLPE